MNAFTIHISFAIIPLYAFILSCVLCYMPLFTCVFCVIHTPTLSVLPPFKDQSEAKEAEVQTAIAIGVPVGIVLIIIVIGVVGLLCYLRQRRIDKGPKE